MNNLFSHIEEEILLDEKIIFDEEKIKSHINNFLLNKLNSSDLSKRGFVFEEIVYDFLTYMNIKFTKTNKTRDQGLDGVIKMPLGFFGDIDLGLQIKYKLIDSNDIDLFLSSLKNAELQLGVILCKDSRNLSKYELNSKLKMILLSKGIEIKEKLIKEKVDMNPVLVLKFDDILEIISSQIRSIARGIYKK